MALIKGPEEGRGGGAAFLSMVGRNHGRAYLKDSFEDEATCVECGKAGWKKQQEGPQFLRGHWD